MPYKAPHNRRHSPPQAAAELLEDGASKRMPRHLKRVGGVWHYYRRVPRLFRGVDTREHVEQSLYTADLNRAEQLKPAVAKAVEERWIALKQGAGDKADDAYAGAVKLARLEGFQYRTAAELAQGPLAEILRRLDRLDGLGIMDATAAAALLGGRERPHLSLTAAHDKFLELTRDRQRRYSADQLRRWKAPRLKAVRNFCKAIAGKGGDPDKDVSQIGRADALLFVDWWMKRVDAGEVTTHTVNRDLNHLGQILRTVSEKLALGLSEPFKGLRLEEEDAKQGLPIPPDFIREMILAPGALDGMNEEARDITLVFIETGMRPSEICALLPEDIFLVKPKPWLRDEEFVPYVKVKGGKVEEGRRVMKTKYSEREMPLVGCALEAMRRHSHGFPRYRGAPATLSATVNAYMRDNGLLPSEEHTFYGLRHGFADRLTAADAPDRIDADLKGHKFPRPKYGKGPTLAHKRDWLLKIAVSVKGRER